MKKEFKVFVCGCRIDRDRYALLSLTYCPLHKSAPKLYEALKLVGEWIGGDKDEDEITSFIDSLIAEVEGK